MCVGGLSAYKAQKWASVVYFLLELSLVKFEKESDQTMAGAGSARQTSLRIGDTVLFQVSSGRESREKTGYIYSELSR